MVLVSRDHKYVQFKYAPRYKYLYDTRYKYDAIDIVIDLLVVYSYFIQLCNHRSYPFLRRIEAKCAALTRSSLSHKRILLRTVHSTYCMADTHKEYKYEYEYVHTVCITYVICRMTYAYVDPIIWQDGGRHRTKRCRSNSRSRHDDV